MSYIKQIKQEEKKKELKKYTVKPPKDLQSKFERKQAAKAQAERESEEAKRRAEEEERQLVSSLNSAVGIVLSELFSLNWAV